MGPGRRRRSGGLDGGRQLPGRPQDPHVPGGLGPGAPVRAGAGHRAGQALRRPAVRGRSQRGARVRCPGSVRPEGRGAGHREGRARGRRRPGEQRRAPDAAPGVQLHGRQRFPGAAGCGPVLHRLRPGPPRRILPDPAEDDGEGCADRVPAARGLRPVRGAPGGGRGGPSPGTPAPDSSRSCGR
ncbi:Uncharacterised protein [Mycobacteroides abscessus subsp. abscessus]|nr:Uncharacterised protein [Mycobacteroides abscessus subsp. abscessus]